MINKGKKKKFPNEDLDEGNCKSNLKMRMMNQMRE